MSAARTAAFLRRRGRIMPGDDLPRRPPQGLDRARGLAQILDRSLRIPGTSLRFGLDPLLGLLPVGGDVISSLASGYILYIAWRNGAPGSLIGRMLLNLLFDTLVGSVPLIGDLFDAGWQANSKNVDLLEDWLGEGGARHHASPAILVGVLAALLVLIAGVVGLVWWIGSLLFQGVLSGGPIW